LHNQEDSETLKGALEARLERTISKQTTTNPPPQADTYAAGLWLLSALPLFRHDANMGGDKRKKKKKRPARPKVLALGSRPG
jgi:hypothetical protein